MRIKIVLSAPSYAQTANIPCDGTDTVLQLKQKLRKRLPVVPEGVELMFDGGKLFDEDTLESLGIKEGDVITEDNGNAGLPPTSVDLTVGDLLIQENVTSINTAPSTPAPVATTPTPQPTPAPTTQEETVIILANPVRPLDEVLEVVFDISASMDARFVDTLSRLSSSKICFGAFIDKTLAYEYSHAVGLICFGQNVYEKLPITKQLSTFESVFGDLIKTEGATNLYPAVDLAVKKINAYAKELPPDPINKRIMCFTDGGDNSGWSAYDVARSVTAAGIVVDAVIVGGRDEDHTNLRSLAHCSGGICVRIPEQEASLSSIFEREQILALSVRVARPVLQKLTVEEFKSYGDLTLYPYVGVDLKEIPSSAAPKPAVAAKAVSADAIQALPSATTATTRSGGAVKRILKEYQDSQREGLEIFLVDNDIGNWRVFVHGPPGTSYSGAVWVLSIEFPSDYPFKPPKVVFLTPIYHCNINDQGRICLDILKDQWSPALTASRVVKSIESLLVDPNPDDALEAWKASLARTDRPRYEEQVRQHTATHACASVLDACQRYNLG